MTLSLHQSDMVDQFIGNYRVTGVLGEGGMGIVYVAEHKLLGRPAAIKVLLPQYSKSQHIVERFFNEARAATEIRHPGIVEIYDFGYQDGGGAFIAMELLDGEDLENRLQRLGQLAITDAIQFAGQIASALGAAHQCGVIHRDLKPANIFLVPDPQVAGGERIKLLDFGIAKVSMVEEEASNLTRAGVIMGTPHYMAPEQCRGAGSVDGRADLYSVGCILFEMLCGKPPFAGASSIDVMSAQVRTPPPRPSELRPEIPVALEIVILRLLAKDPAQRYQYAGELEAALKELLPKHPEPISVIRTGVPPAPKTGLRRVMALGVLLGSIVAGAAFAVMRPASSTSDQPAPDTAAPTPGVATPPAPVPVPAPAPPPPLVFCAPGAGECPYPHGDDAVTWTIRSTPPRATVMYQGENKGETPLVVKLSRNDDRTETFRLRLYDHVDTDVELIADHDQNVDVMLRENIKITLFSKPEGAVIYNRDSNQGIGVTPGEIGVPPGDQPIHLMLRLPGYQDEIVEVTPTKNQKKTVTLTRLVNVSIESEPPAAEVWQGGEKLGHTPYQAQVPRSKQDIVYELKHPGYHEQTFKLRPLRDSSQKITLTPL